MPDSRNPDNRDLDALIEEALASYTSAELDPSLRTRIMAHVAEAAPRPKRLRLLAPAAACAAALVFVFLLHPWTLHLRTPAMPPDTPTAPKTLHGNFCRQCSCTARTDESRTAADNSSASSSPRTPHTPQRT